MKKSYKNYLLIGIVAFLMLGSSVVGTMAYLTDTPEEVVNTFTLGNVTTEIEEIFEKETNTTFKKEPKVKNTGKNDCYVRVRVVASPEEALELSGFDTVNWTEKKEDGFYYYKHVLKSGETTKTSLFNKVTVKDTSIDGFEVTVYQEAVQSILYAKDGTDTNSASEIWNCYENKTVPETFNKQ